MSNFKDSPHFANHDDYYTPEYAWSWINHLLPKDKIIWEAFMLNSNLSKSPEYLEKLGCNVVCDRTMNMLEKQPDNYDMIVSNPPFNTEIKQKCLKKLVELDKPFIILMNSTNIYTKYTREIFGDNIRHLQIINPCAKINYDKMVDGKICNKKKNSASFYTVYVCYKMNFDNMDLWLQPQPTQKELEREAKKKAKAEEKAKKKAEREEKKRLKQEYKNIMKSVGL